MKILVDLDETLVNLVDKWCWYYNSKYDTNYTREDMTNYGDIGDEQWIEFLRIPGFHADLPWMDPNAPEVLRELRRDGHRIIIATAAVAWESARDKYSWVHTHLRIPGIIEGMRDLVITRDKGLIKADVLIDDNPAYLDDFPGTRVVYTQPWNTRYTGADYRVDNWTDVREVLGLVEQDRVLDGPPSFYRGGCY